MKNSFIFIATLLLCSSHARANEHAQINNLNFGLSLQQLKLSGYSDASNYYGFFLGFTHRKANALYVNAGFDYSMGKTEIEKNLVNLSNENPALSAKNMLSNTEIGYRFSPEGRASFTPLVGAQSVSYNNKYDKVLALDFDLSWYAFTLGAAFDFAATPQLNLGAEILVVLPQHSTFATTVKIKGQEKSSNLEIKDGNYLLITLPLRYRFAPQWQLLARYSVASRTIVPKDAGDEVAEEAFRASTLQLGAAFSL
jgi:hypothetical protein